MFNVIPLRIVGMNYISSSSFSLNFFLVEETVVRILWKETIDLLHKEFFVHVTLWHFCWRQYFCPPGVKRGTKWGKPAHLLTNGYKKLQIWLDMLFTIRNLVVTFIFSIHEFLYPFWGNPGVKRVTQNGVKLPISSQIAIRTYKLVWIWYSAWQLWWWDPFSLYPNFRVPQGSKGAQQEK